MKAAPVTVRVSPRSRVRAAGRRAGRIGRRAGRTPEPDPIPPSQARTAAQLGAAAFGLLQRGDHNVLSTWTWAARVGPSATTTPTTPPNFVRRCGTMQRGVYRRGALKHSTPTFAFALAVQQRVSRVRARRQAQAAASRRRNFATFNFGRRGMELMARQHFDGVTARQPVTPQITEVTAEQKYENDPVTNHACPSRLENGNR